MADYEVENLKITLSVDDSGVSEKITSLQTAFRELSTSIRGSVGEELKKLGEGFKIFSDTLPHLGNASEAIKKFVANIEGADFNAFSAGLVKVGNAFSQIQLDPKAVDGIRAFAVAMRTMSNSALAFDTTGMEKVIAAGEKLDTLAGSVKKAASVGSGLRDLASGLKNMPNALKTFASQDFHAWASNVTLATSRLRELNTATSALSGKGVHTISLLARSLSTLAEFGKDKGLEENLNKAGQALINMARNMAKAIGDEQLRKFKELTNAASRLADAIKRIGKANFDKIVSPSKGMKRFSKADTMTYTEEDYRKKNPRSGWEFTKWSFKNIISAPANVGKAASKIAKLFESIGNSYLKVGRILSKPLVFSVKAISKSISLVASGFKKLATIVSKPLIAPFKAAGNAIVSLHQKFTNFLHSVGRIAIYRAIRSGIKMITTAAKEGVTNLYNWASIVGNDFKPTMDSLATSALYAKNSLAAMASPLLDALAPALEVATDTLVEFMNKLNQLFATLTGKDTWRKAIRKQAEYSAEIDNTGRALDDLKKTILGIDEINPLNGQNDRGRGSSDITPDYEGMFEVVDVTDNVADMFKNGDWKSVGETLTDGLITALGKINWSVLQSKAVAVGGKIAGFVNGALGKENLWTTIGSTVSGGLETATSGFLSFTDSVDWKKIGNNIASGFKTAVKGVTWSKVGKVAASGVSLFSKLFSGFVNAMTDKDWADLGGAIGSAVNGAVMSVDWEQTLSDLGSFTNGMLNALLTAAGKIKWADLANSLTNGVIAALGKINWTNIQIKTNDLSAKLGGAFNAAFGKKDLWTSVGTTLGNGLNTATGSLLTFTQQVDWAKMGGNIAEGFKKAVNTVKWADVGKTAATAISLFANLFHGFVNSMTKKDWEDLGKSIGTAVQNAIKTINFKTLIPDLVTFAKGLLGALNTAIGTINWKEVLDEVWKGVKKADWKGLFKEIGDFLAKTWPVFVIPLAFNAGPVLKAISSILGPWGTLVAAIVVTGVPAMVAGLKELKEGFQKLREESPIIDQIATTFEKAEAVSFKNQVSELDEWVTQGLVTEKEAERMSEQLFGVKLKFDAVSIAARKDKEATQGASKSFGEVTTSAGKANTALNKLTPRQDAVNEKMQIMNERAKTVGKSTWINDFANGIEKGIPKVSGDVSTIVSKISILNSQSDLSPLYPWTWGKDLGYNLGDGIASAESYVDGKAKNMAQVIRNNLAFSKPKEGPLSDADKYGPDFVELFADGMMQKAYLVENAARNIAAMADSEMSVSPKYNAKVNATLGVDTTTLTRSVAQGTEDANAAQNELLREQNDLLRQILARTGDGVSAGTIMSSMERASRRAGVAVA